jgi:hypothetical protein
MSQERHPWRFNNYGNRQDGVDGWGSPMVNVVQRALDPFLVVDTGLLLKNPVIREDSHSGKVSWPYRAPTYVPGEVIERSIEVFNGALGSAAFALRYTAHWDAPGGPVALPTQTTDAFAIDAGFHVSQILRFPCPASDLPRRPLHLIVESLRTGQLVYREDRIRLTISRSNESATAVFAGADDQTRGDWPRRYGTEGFVLAGGSVKLPSDLEFTWLSGAEWTWENSTVDSRALEMAEEAPAPRLRRAACRYGDTSLSFSLDLGTNALRRLSMYCIDWDDTGRELEVWRTESRTCARPSLHPGRWLT